MKYPPFRHFLRSISGARLVRVACAFCLAGFAAGRAAEGVTVQLAQQGRALHPVVVGEKASQRTRQAAEDLAKYLGLISGGDFAVREGDGSAGIAVGIPGDFPALGLARFFDPKDPTRRDEYLSRSHDRGVHLVGATDLAAQHAVWGFLFGLGYRQFFPTETWEFIPEESNLSIAVDLFERPDFYNRNGPRVASGGDVKLWARWHDRNRMTSSFVLDTGHSYNGIIERNREAFVQNPQFLALVDGIRGGGRGDKFCISNGELRRLVVADARRRIERNPDVMSISMDPSDGGSWCECAPCKEMGSVSDRVIILANEVASAINEMGHGEKYVGTYAYNQHSPPPRVDVHPKVIVSIATAYIRGGFTFAELVDGWSRRATMLGIREYYDTFVWDQGRPRRGPGGSIKYLTEKTPYYYERGARFMNANSTDAWGANGLGFYLSAQLLWDVKTVERVRELIDDFLEKAFGEAREPMRNYYRIIAGDYDSPHTDNDLLAHMYGYIREGRQLAADARVRARLDELALYTRYVELLFKFEQAGDEAARATAAQDVFRHAYRMQGTMMSPVAQLYVYMRRPNVAVKIPGDADPGVASVGRTLEDREPWKSSKRFSDSEIAGFLEAGVAAYKKDEMGFEVVAFSEELEPAAGKLELPKVSTGDMGGNNTFRGRYRMFTWLKPGEQVALNVTGGLIYRDRGNVRFMLFSPKEATHEPVATDESVPPNGQTYAIGFRSPYDGRHVMEWLNGDDRTRIEWDEGHPMTMPASMAEPARLGSNARLYFYVPKGTGAVGGHLSDNDVQVYDGSGRKVLDLRNTKGGAGYFNIPVLESEAGTLWMVQGSNVLVRLMTVPPYLARSGRELLLPREVVEADSIKRRPGTN
jgi:hypothetical protein